MYIGFYNKTSYRSIPVGLLKIPDGPIRVFSSPPYPVPPPGVLGVLLINVFFGWNIF